VERARERARPLANRATALELVALVQKTRIRVGLHVAARELARRPPSYAGRKARLRGHRSARRFRLGMSLGCPSTVSRGFHATCINDGFVCGPISPRLKVIPRTSLPELGCPNGPNALAGARRPLSLRCRRRSVVRDPPLLTGPSSRLK
jgi:hypothetical protein